MITSLTKTSLLILCIVTTSGFSFFLGRLQSRTSTNNVISEPNLNPTDNLDSSKLSSHDFSSYGSATVIYSLERNEVIINYLRPSGSISERSTTQLIVSFNKENGLQIRAVNLATPRGSVFYNHLNKGLSSEIESRIAGDTDLGNQVEYFDLDGDGLAEFRKQLGSIFFLRNAVWEEIDESKFQIGVGLLSKTDHKIIPLGNPDK